MDYILLVLSAALVNNVVLVRFFGLCPFMGVSTKLATSLAIGGATTFVMTIGGASSWLIEYGFLQPLGITSFRIMAYILVIAVAVQFTETAIKKLSPPLFKALGIYLPLITTNCAVLGVPLIAVNKNYSFSQSVIFGFGSAVGFSLVMIIFAGLRERLDLADIPDKFKGAPIAFVTAGFLALTFMGFGGLIGDF